MKRLTTLILILKLEDVNTKEKAKELVQKYIDNAYQEDKEGLYTPIAKQCAIIAVDEILDLDEMHFLDREYWQEVKTEIEKL